MPLYLITQLINEKYLNSIRKNWCRFGKISKTKSLSRKIHDEAQQSASRYRKFQVSLTKIGGAKFKFSLMKITSKNTQTQVRRTQTEKEAWFLVKQKKQSWTFEK